MEKAGGDWKFRVDMLLNPVVDILTGSQTDLRLPQAS